MNRRITELEEIKKIELEILLYIDKVCKEHRIKYFLAYGTLLGAVRHKGFIPWDDDIDIIMPRPDYEKFIRVMNDENTIYRMVCLENSKKDYSYPFAKVYDSRTSIYESWRPMKEELGLYVDVFPIEGLGDEKDAINNANKLLKITKQIWYMDTVKGKNIKGVLLNVFGRKNLNRCFKYISKKNDFYNTKYVGVLTWPSDQIEMAEQKYYLESIDACFEGYSFPIPKYYDIILKKIYGNYMEFPPKAEQTQKHPFDVWWK